MIAKHISNTVKYISFEKNTIKELEKNEMYINLGGSNSDNSNSNEDNESSDSLNEMDIEF